jgi:hypothetical protein
LYLFNSQADYDSKESSKNSGNLPADSMTKLTLEMSSDTQGKNEYFFAVGGKENDEWSTPVKTATITVCGKETFEAVDSVNA